jgi:hypothetical protein
MNDMRFLAAKLRHPLAWPERVTPVTFRERLWSSSLRVYPWGAVADTPTRHWSVGLDARPSSERDERVSPAVKTGIEAYEDGHQNVVVVLVDLDVVETVDDSSRNFSSHRDAHRIVSTTLAASTRTAPSPTRDPVAGCGGRSASHGANPR